MTKLFLFLGDRTIPYRTLMANHTDFYLEGFFIKKSQVVIAEQTHSNNVHICSDSDSGAGFDEHLQITYSDALISNIPNQFLLIRTADCFPILLYDQKSEAVGAIHSGREGTKQNIVAQTIIAMQNAYSSNPSDLHAWIGAGICKKHYQVSDNIWNDFSEICTQNRLFIDKSDIPFLDIQNVVIQQLLLAGIKAENIVKLDICTYESKNHFSYRRDGTHNRQINVIGMSDGKYNL